MKLRRTAITTGNLVVFIAACLYVLWSCSGIDLSEELSAATADGNYGRMELFLRLGADPDFKPKDSRSLLQISIDAGDARAAAILLNRGATTKVLDSHYQQLFMPPKFQESLAKETTLLHRQQ